VREQYSEAMNHAPILAGVRGEYPLDHARAGTCFVDAGIPVYSWRYRYFKRMMDLACASILLVVFAIPGLLIAAAILITSPGPVFYREKRIGRGGAPFRIWKFRSMRQDATEERWFREVFEAGTGVQWRMRKDLSDPRVTRIGRFLRQWSLDELPQLLNVLSGEMSLVGPRPIVEEEVPFYGDQMRIYLAATPGLSGLWQTSGRSKLGYRQRAELDADYVQSWSLGSDLRILLRTVPAVIGRVGAY
jgi:exopolysaccharide production protein ExoY